MIKSKEQKEIEALAKKYRQMDKRLSWDNCLKKAKSKQRMFGGA